jgi:hydroxypyruvate reductase
MIPLDAQLRADARAIFAAAVAAADPHRAIAGAVQRAGDVLSVAADHYDLAQYRNLYVVGAGKAGAPMAQAIEQLLARPIAGGLVAVKHGYRLPSRQVTIAEAGHPVPDAAGMEATRSVIELLERAGSDDLVIVLVSGGASALLVAPAEGLTLPDKQVTTELLLNSGATIQEINTVRKHLSRIKGGGLARVAFPATVLTLTLSDVVGDRIDVIGSGPTAPDASTFGDALRVLDAYHLCKDIPPTVLRMLERGSRGEIAETPKPGDPMFNKVRNIVVANNRSALVAARQRACDLGYRALVLSSFVEGEARQAAVFHAAIVKEILASNEPVCRPACVLSGGETTVAVRGKGRGGRNQEFGLAAAIEIDGLDGVVMLSGGTDGTDGPTEAAGALVDGGTTRRGESQDLDAQRHLAANDSYHFLKATGDLLVTGPTYTNVMDIRVMLIA